MRKLLAAVLLGYLIAAQATFAVEYVSCTDINLGNGLNAANAMDWATAKSNHAEGDDYIWVATGATEASPVVHNASGCNLSLGGINGASAGNMTTITAEPEGGIVIDGNGVRPPLYFNSTRFVHVIGFNFRAEKVGTSACASAGSNCQPISVSGDSHDNRVTRVTGCNAATNYNVHTLSIASGSPDPKNNIFEDVFLCGAGRKSIQQHKVGNTLANSNRFRRLFIIRGGSESNWGPHHGTSFTYDSQGAYVDNMVIVPDRRPDVDIGIASEDGAQQDGTYYAKNGTTLGNQLNNWDMEEGPDGNQGLIGGDQMTDLTMDHDSRLRITSSLVYVPAGADFHQPNGLVKIELMDNIAIDNVIVVNKSTNVNSALQGFRLSECTANCTSPHLTTSITNTSWINSGGGLTTNTITGYDVQTNNRTGTSIGAVYSGGGTPYLPNASQGGQLCYQSLDAVIQDGASGRPGPTPLFVGGEWPMESRINYEMINLGRGAYSATAVIEQALGSQIPDTCGGDSGAATPTPTATATATATATRTFTRSNTPTRTNTPIPPTATFTRTPTRTPTHTATVPPTLTHTAVPTNTPPAPTFTHTNTPLPSATATLTHTPTSTATFTPTQPTLTPSNTRTPNLTPESPVIITGHWDYFYGGGWVFVRHGYAVSEPPPHYVQTAPTRTPTP